MGKGRMKILVVEDDLEHLAALGEGLTGLGAEVVLASSGREAIERVASFAPDAALVDVMLPDMSGITLANVLRGLAGEGLRVVAFSGADPGKIRDAVGRSLFDDYVAKPAPLISIALALRC
ncbi:MAG TPA: response regulator [Kofleriaceae bacterium]|nr:response regulator [Kofleriaceae bacterium]